MEPGDSEPGTGLGSLGPAFGPEICTVLDGHGEQPTDTSTSMLHGDASRQALDAQLAALRTHVQDGGNLSFWINLKGDSG